MKGQTWYLEFVFFSKQAYSAEQDGIKYYLLSLWDDSTWDWTSVSPNRSSEKGSVKLLNYGMVSIFRQHPV